MKTKIINENELNIACDLLKNDEVVALPTETVYGLGANALSANALQKIFIAKGRPSDNPLIVHISNFSDLDFLTSSIPKNAKLLMDKFWPGALTIIFPKSQNVPLEISRGLDTIAIRFPSHKTMLDVISNCGFPIAAPSANISGRPSTTCFEHVFDDLNGKVSGIVKGDISKIGLESTVIDLTRTPPVLLRPGGITLEQLRDVLGEVLVDTSINSKISDTKKVSSPGMKYRHYAPKAPLTVVSGNAFKCADYISKIATKNTGILAFDEFSFENSEVLHFGSINNQETQAQLLFAKLREFDNTNVTEILAMCPTCDGLGLATTNRLKKSAGFLETKIQGKVFGLTGRSGAGKSTVSKFFAKKGFKIIDCDKIYSNLLETSSLLIDELHKNFDDCFESGKLNRQKLSSIVFNNSQKLKLLNNITFKYIKQEVENIILSTDTDVILDAPLLFEANFDIYCDKIFGVIANEDTIISRLSLRDAEKNILNRLKNQKNNSFFIQSCDIIIENNSSLQALEDFILKGDFYEFIT